LKPVKGADVEVLLRPDGRVDIPGQVLIRTKIMGEFTDKAKGAVKKTVGSVKEGVGKATNNAELETKGKAQKVEGHVDDLKGTVKGKINDV